MRTFYLCLDGIDLVAFQYGRFFIVPFVEEAFLEDEDGDDADGNRSIGEVEDGAEELKFITAYKWHP